MEFPHTVKAPCREIMQLYKSTSLNAKIVLLVAIVLVTWFPLAAIFIGVALLGRWIQLHPEKVVPEGMFQGPNSSGARLIRLLLAVVGSFAVWGGTTGALNVLLSPLSRRSEILSWIVMAVAVSAGIVAAIHVREEVRARGKYSPRGLYGWRF
jgi:hypothetical protein